MFKKSYLRFLLNVIILSLVCLESATADSLDDYASIRKDIQTYQVTDSTVRRVQALFPSEDKFLAALQNCKKSAAAQPDNWILLASICQKSYFDFIHLPANADILYEFITRQAALFPDPVVGGEGYPGPVLAWSWSYRARAELDAYLATHQRRWLDLLIDGATRALAVTDAKLKIKDDFNHDAVKGWSFVSNGKSGREETLAGRIVAPILKMALVARGDHDIDTKTQDTIQQLAAQSIDILRTYLPEEQVKGSERFFIYQWTGEEDAINHMAAYAEAAAYAYQLTGEEAFRQSVEGFLAYFEANVTKQRLNAQPADTYSWPYQVVRNKSKQIPEPLWKASITIPALFAIAKTGITVTPDILRGTYFAITNYVLGSHYSINAYLAGDKVFPLTGWNAYFSNFVDVNNMSLFIHLDLQFPGLRGSLLNAIAARPDLFPVGLLADAASAEAYAHILRYPSVQ